MPRSRSVEVQDIANLARNDSLLSQAVLGANSIHPLARADRSAMRGENEGTIEPFVPITLEEMDTAFPTGYEDIPSPVDPEAERLKLGNLDDIPPANIEEVDDAATPEDALMQTELDEIPYDTPPEIPDSTEAEERTDVDLTGHTEEELMAPVPPEPVEPTRPVPQGMVAQASKPELDVIADPTSKDDYVFMADHPAFAQLRNSIQQKFQEPSAPDALVSAMDISTATPSTQLSARRTANIDKDIAASVQTLMAAGYDQDAIETVLRGEPGLIPQTAPWEYVTGMTAMTLKLGGKSLLKSLSPSIVAGAAPQAAVFLTADEIAEQHPVLGILFGLGAGTATEIGTRAATKLATTIDSEVTSTIMGRVRSIGQDARMDARLVKMFSKDFKAPKKPGITAPDEATPYQEGIRLAVTGESVPVPPPAKPVKGVAQPTAKPGAPIALETGGRSVIPEYPGSPTAPAVPSPVAVEAAEQAAPLVPIEYQRIPNLHGKLTALKTKKIEDNLAIGNFSDIATHRAAMNILAIGKQAPYLPPEAASVIAQAEESLLGITPTETNPDQVVNPFLDTGAPLTVQGLERFRTPLARSVAEEWYGPTQLSRKAIVARLSDRFSPKVAEELADFRIADGTYGINFIEDVVGEFELQVAAVSKVGALGPGERTRLLDQVIEDMHQKYQEGIGEDVQSRLDIADPTEMAMLKHDYVRGGQEERDAKFMTPTVEGVTGVKGVPRQGLAAPSFKFNDWTIDQQLVRIEPQNRLAFRPEPTRRFPDKEITEAPRGQLNFVYDDIQTLSQAQQSARGFIAKWSGKKVLQKSKVKNPKSGKFPLVIPEADKLKVRTKMFKKKEDRVEGEPDHFFIQALPDIEVENAARLLGWDETRLANTSVMGKDGLRYQYLAEDIANNKGLWDDWNTTSASTVAYEENLPVGERSTKFKVLSASAQSYRQQREEYIKKVLGIPLDPAEAARQKRFYFSELDRWAAMHNKLMDDIRLTENTDLEANAKRMYMLVGDTAAGTNRYDDMVTIQRKSKREIAYEAWKEVQAFQSGEIDDAQTSGAIFEYAMDNDMTYDEAQELYEENRLLAEGSGELQDAMTDFMKEDYGNLAQEMAAQEAGIASDVAGTSMQNVDRVLNTTNTSGQAQSLIKEQLKEITKPTAETIGMGSKNLTPNDKYMLAKYVESFENVLGTRVIEPRYVPGAPGRKAKLNIIKINNTDDLMSLVSDADMADLNFDPEMLIGLPPKGGVSNPMVQKMARVIRDIDDQLQPAAQALLADPDNIVKALAFEKLRAVQGSLLTAYTDGKIGGQSKKILQSYDMRAEDDQMLLDRIAGMIDENYPIYGASEADTRTTVAMAEMYDGNLSATDRIVFNNEIAKLYEDTGYATVKRGSVKRRKQFNNILKKACE